jgi:hypothetical protein
MAALQQAIHDIDRPLADFCRSALSIAVIARETAEFDSDGLADARQWAKPTLTGQSRTSAVR